MEVEICGFFTDSVLVIFGIVAAIKCPETFSEYAMQVLRFIDLFIFSHYHNVGFHQVLLEADRSPAATCSRELDCGVGQACSTGPVRACVPKQPVDNNRRWRFGQ